MKALCVRNGPGAPWADWIASGEKTIETRTWWTGHRGPLLIVRTGQKPTSAIAITKLVGCRAMTPADELRARCRWQPGLWAWVLEGTYRIEPFRVRGQLGLFDVEVRE